LILHWREKRRRVARFVDALPDPRRAPENNKMNELKLQSVLSPLVSRQTINASSETAPTNGIGELGRLSAGEDFAAKLKDAVRSVNTEQQQANTLQTQFELGDDNVSLPQVMLALNRSSIAFESINQVRNRLLTAYQEVMSMQV
jgi:flagellar hook-basal body complex protein FliE